MKKPIRRRVMIALAYVASTLVAVGIFMAINYPHRQSWMQWAIEHRLPWLAHGLLILHVSADAPDERGRTPLHWTAYYGADEVAEVLLAYASPASMKPDGAGSTPDELARTLGHRNLALKLYEFKWGGCFRDSPF